MKGNVCDLITPNFWPPNSSDCNPLDFNVFSTVERETSKTLFKTNYELKARTAAEFTDFKKETGVKGSQKIPKLTSMPISLNKFNPEYFKILLI